jgi:hypothetical protein
MCITVIRIGSFDIRCDIAGMKVSAELKKLLDALFFPFSQKTVNSKIYSFTILEIYIDSIFVQIIALPIGPGTHLPRHASGSFNWHSVVLWYIL